MSLPLDTELFNKDLADLQEVWRKPTGNAPGDRRARLMCELASLCKRFINERIAVEEMLTQKGVTEMSASIYCMQWMNIYYQALEEQTERRERGYWKKLWAAIRGR